MHCERCGHVNPPENYFCGHCGAPQLHQHDLPVDPIGHFAAPEEPIMSAVILDEPSGSRDSERLPESAEGVSGPSFLGLNPANPEEQPDLSYLYEDAPKLHYGRWLAVLLILAGAGVLVYGAWQRPDWYQSFLHRIKPSERTAGLNASLHPVVENPPTATVEPPRPQTPEQAPNDNTRAPGAGEPTSGTSAKSRSLADVNNPAPGSASVASSPSAAKAETPPEMASTNDSPVASSSINASPVPPSVVARPGADSADVQRPQTAQASAKSSVAGFPRPPVVSPAAGKTPDPGEELFSRGEAHLYGRGMPLSCSQALVELRRAADLGNLHARSQLGALYATGHCVPLDRVRAYTWFSLAANGARGRDSLVEHNRRMLWDQMTEAERASVRQSSY